MGADFKRIYRRGRRAKGTLFTAIVLENELGRARLGLSVAKRHWKRAVDRNRVRRLLREAFRLELANLPAGLDVVLVAHPAPARPALAELRAELTALVARARAKRPRPESEDAP